MTPLKFFLWKPLYDTCCTTKYGDREYVPVLCLKLNFNKKILANVLIIILVSSVQNWEK